MRLRYSHTQAFRSIGEMQTYVSIYAIVDTMSQPYAHISHLYFWGILIYAHSQTCIVSE